MGLPLLLIPDPGDTASRWVGGSGFGDLSRCVCIFNGRWEEQGVCIPADWISDDRLLDFFVWPLCCMHCLTLAVGRDLWPKGQVTLRTLVAARRRCLRGERKGKYVRWFKTKKTSSAGSKEINWLAYNI